MSAQEHADRVQYTGRMGHVGRVTTIVSPELAGSPVLAEMVDMLRETDNDVPRWLEGVVPGCAW